ncbi:MAG: cytoplasmic protein [Desulfosudaceae bacterium]
MNQTQDIDFTVDENNLYREESLTDIKVAAIRKMIPIKPDGTDDDSRSIIFVGHTQLMSPEGPLPLQAKLEATTLEAAIAEFPRAMQAALAEMAERIQKMQQQQQQQQDNDSRIITPSRTF